MAGWTGPNHAGAVPWDRRGGARRWMAALALAGPTLASGCREEESALPVIERGDIDLELGFAGVVKPNAWNLLQVRVRNRGEDFRGRIEARVSAGAKDTTYGAALEVPGRSAALREVSFPVFLPDESAEVTVDLTAGRFGRRFLVEGHDTREHDARILVIGSARRDLTNLTAAAAGKRIRTARSAPEDLSPSPFAYEPFSLIVLDGTALASAPGGAAGALARWVERGGTLIAFPGPEWGSGIPGATIELLGVSPGSAEATLPPELAARLGRLASSVSYRDLNPGPNAAEAPGRLACVASRGAGKVFTFRVAPEGDFPAPDAAPAIHDALWYAIARSFGFAGDPAPGLASMEGAAVFFLSGMHGFRPPPRGAVILGLILYLAVGFILPYRLGARRGRREWSYAAVIAAAAAATFVIYRYGVFSAMDSAELEELTVLRLHRDGRAAEATSFIAAISPRPERLDLGAGFLEEMAGAGGGPLPRPLIFRDFEVAGGGGSLELDPRDRWRQEPARLYPNAARFFRYDYQAPVSQLAAVEFVKDPERDREEIRFTNRAGTECVLFRLEQATIASTGQHVWPGASISLTRIPRSSRPASILKPDAQEPERPVPPAFAYVSGRSQGPEALREAARDLVFRTIDQQESSLSADARPRYLAAVFAEGVFPGSRGFRRKAVTVLVVEVPPGRFH